VGCAKSFKSLDWVITERILWAWVMTIPAAGVIAYLLVRLLGGLGLH
jgi:PiT family inorganic phosphate transporter